MIHKGGATLFNYFPSFCSACAGSSLLCTGFLWPQRAGLLSSLWSGFLLSCGAEHRRCSSGLLAGVHWRRGLAACGIFPEPRSNLCSLPRQVGS